MESHISFVELLSRKFLDSIFVELQLSHVNFGSVFNMGYQFKNVMFSGKLSTKNKLKSKPLPTSYEMQSRYWFLAYCFRHKLKDCRHQLRSNFSSISNYNEKPFLYVFQKVSIDFILMAIKIIIRFSCKEKHPSQKKSHFPYYLTLAQIITLCFSIPRSQTSYHFMRPKLLLLLSRLSRVQLV